MAYTKTNWQNGATPAINADNLNHMEQGIYDLCLKAVEILGSDSWLLPSNNDIDHKKVAYTVPSGYTPIGVSLRSGGGSTFSEFSVGVMLGPPGYVVFTAKGRGSSSGFMWTPTAIVYCVKTSMITD
jgi:hypothetical protein